MEPQGSCRSSVLNFGNAGKVECDAGKLRQKANLMAWTSALPSRTVDLGYMFLTDDNILIPVQLLLYTR